MRRSDIQVKKKVHHPDNPGVQVQNHINHQLRNVLVVKLTMIPKIYLS